LLNRLWTLATRPDGEPNTGNFELKTIELTRDPDAGQILVRNRFLSLDPYMRWRMNDAKSYAKPVGLGEVMVGATVGEVIRSNHADFAPGDIVLGGGGWQDLAVLDGKAARKIDDCLPPSTALGILGSPGFTAYAGLMKIGSPKPGETVLVGAATGPVGSMVGQLAKLSGCRAVAIVGGPEKAALAIERFGFDAAVDHGDRNVAAALADACPDGVDVYFENIGGKIFELVLPLLNDFARVPVCGLVSQYNAGDGGPSNIPLAVAMQHVLVKRLTLRGFIITDFSNFLDEFLKMATPLVASGKLVYLEDMVDNLENAPAAFIGLLKGQNIGKVIVRL